MNKFSTRLPRVALAALNSTSVPRGVVSSLRAQTGVEGLLLQVKSEIVRIGDEHKNTLANHTERLNELSDRQRDVEQNIASRNFRGRGGANDADSLGERVINSAEYTAFGGSNARGKFSVRIKQAITSLSTSAGGMISPDHRPDVIALPRRRLTVRALLAPGNTNSNNVQYARQTTRTNNATVVTEGAKKPESAYAWTQADAPVRTIAHFVKASRQAMDDAPLLASTIDGELRYGLDLTEESQLLLGSGTGQNIFGIIPQATAYDTSRNGTGDTAFDTLAHAIAQAETALLPATGIVMNIDDLEALKLIKDGEGRYIGGGPFGPPITMVWGRPVVGTPVVTSGKFLVGAFLDGAQIFDRLEAEVLVSTENEDDFVKNLITVRAEERLALAVKRPTAFIYGDLLEI
jgi:HK97 family phage major capsid protein